MSEKNHYSHLYEIACNLNKEYSLTSALSMALEKTTEILNVETGWIWLTESNNKSVYLAASYNLPPALSQHPERLSGWCYCIKQYFSDDIEEAINISEIACSRLRDLENGTKGLKFHATIPIIINDQKVGIMNLLSEQSKKLSDHDLTMLNAISELVGSAIQRMRLHQSYPNKIEVPNKTISQILDSEFFPKLDSIISCLESSKSDMSKVNEVLKSSIELKHHVRGLFHEIKKVHEKGETSHELNYPGTPLSKREIEVLNLVKTGMTNELIGQNLFISERTVKFHITSILSKLNADNRTEAVDIAFRRGLISN